MDLPNPGSSGASAHNAGMQPAKGNQVVQWLLANNYLMTALELLVEAQEVGREDEVDGLQIFFSDRQKFPPEELVKFDQKDAANMQKLATEREARLSMTEYELRVTLEDVLSLQSALSRATSVDKGGAAANPEMTDLVEFANSVRRRATSELTEHEQSTAASPDAALSAKDKRQLNAAVRQYLADQGFKLTALTFTEEGAGSVPAQPPATGDTSLLHLWRGYGERLSALSTAKDALASQEKAEQALHASQEQSASLQAHLTEAQAKVQHLEDELELLRKRLDWCEQQTQDAEAKARAAINAAHRASTQDGEAEPSPATEQDGALADVAKAFNAVGVNDALAVVASAIPKIIPHVLINKRDELLPVLEALIEAHGDAGTRDRLCQALFNVVKKPTALQRRMILDSCKALARRIGPLRTADELLPQAWEQVDHRHAERRMLVAEACAELAPLVPPQMASSLLLSMLQHLCADADPGVRSSVAINLAHLLPHLQDADKYLTVQTIFVDLAHDTGRDVQDAVITHLLPHYLRWIHGSDKLHTILLPAVLHRLSQLLDQCPVLGGTDEQLVQTGQAELRLVGEHQQLQAQALLRLFVHLLPALRAAALSNSPEWAVLPDAADEPQADPASRGPRHSLSGISWQGDAGSANGGSQNASGLQITQVTSLPRLDRVETDGRDDFATGSDLDAASESAGASNTRDSHLRLVSSFPRDPLGMHASITQDESMDASGTPKSVASASARSMYSVSLEEGAFAESVSDFPSGPGGPAAAAMPLPEPLPALPSDASAAGHISDWQAAVVFAAWLEAGDAHAQWAELTWLIAQALPLLLTIIRMVPATDDADMLRRRLCSTLRSVCLLLGPAAAAGAVEPLFVASSTVPYRSGSAAAVPHTANVALNLIPQTEEGLRVGRQCVVPMLLAGIMPFVGQGALTAMLHGLCADSADGACWALMHAQDTVAAVQFAGVFEEVRGPLLAVMRDLADSLGQNAHMCAAMLAGAMVPCLPIAQVARQVLPTLEALCGDARGEGSTEMAVDALCEVWRAFAPNAKALQHIHGQLDTLLSSDDHEVQLSVMRALAARAPAVTSAQLEYLLQKVLYILARLSQRSFAGRSPVQLQTMATALFEALQAVDSCKVGEQTVALHLMAALQALQRESEFLTKAQSETLVAMSADLTAATPSMAAPGSLPSNPPSALRPAVTPRSRQPSTAAEIDTRAAGPALQSISSPGDEPRGKLPARSIFGLPKRQPSTSTSTSTTGGGWRDQGRKLFNKGQQNT